MWAGPRNTYVSRETTMSSISSMWEWIIVAIRAASSPAVAIARLPFGGWKSRCAVVAVVRAGGGVARGSSWGDACRREGHGGACQSEQVQARRHARAARGRRRLRI